MLINGLNEREIEILGLLAKGFANKEIANRLFLAPNTVKWYIQQLNSKLGTSNREEIVQEAQNRKLLNLESEAKLHYEAPKSNLPRQSTPFVGRDSELDEVHSILEKPDLRLITILAPGGMGKTRLALEAAEQQRGRFRDGVFFIGLQALSDREQIIPAFAESLSFYLRADERSQKEQLLDFLANKEMLLVTDNWEHLLDGVSLLNDILEAAPKVTILATSREKLKLLGETVYVLRGMEFPNWESPEDALEYDAVQLLVQAAQRVKPDWHITQDNLDFVSRICCLTQGMPLGILLAVSWLDMLSIEEIALEISKSADFLEAQFADVPERQHSIRAVFNASWKRLSQQEQQVFMKLSVFRGGFTKEAAKEVAGASLQTLHRLMEKALVMRTADERYDLHELLRQYAEEQLRLSREENAVRERHSAYYLALAAAMNEYLQDSRVKEGVEKISQNLENIRIAWFFSLEHENYEPLAEACEPLLEAAGFVYLWYRIVDWFRAAVEKLEARGYKDSLLLGHLLLFHGACKWAISPTMEEQMYAREQVEEGLEIAERHQARFELFYGKAMMGHMLHATHEKERRLALIRESHEIAKTLNSSYYLANSFEALATVSWRTEASADLLNYTEKAYELYKTINHPSGIAHQFLRFGQYYWSQHDLEKAEANLREALGRFQTLDFANSLLFTQHNLVILLFEDARIEEAEKHFQEVYEYAKYINQKAALGSISYHFAIVLAAKGFYREAQDLIDEKFSTEEKRKVYLFLGMAGEIEAMRQNYLHSLKTQDHDISDIPRYQISYLAHLLPLIAADWGSRRATAILGWMFHHPHCPKIYKVHAYIQKCLIDYEADLGKEAFEAAWEEGKSLDIVEVLKEILTFYRSQ